MIQLIHFYRSEKRDYTWILCVTFLSVRGQTKKISVEWTADENAIMSYTKNGVINVECIERLGFLRCLDKLPAEVYEYHKEETKRAGLPANQN